MSLKVEWREKAIEELQAIYDYIYFRSPQNAENVVNTILDLGNSLGDFPNKFPIEPILNQEHTRFFTQWSYKIIYRVESERIIILRVFDSRQNPDKLLS
ncbi:type II toxin-antitoxin system RelE/ParE family toxin [Moheibacter lacus]|uniref:Type II toxin-antitoxin system RelE/ParE family toxin n=1 Tax=Moheibacter lacus TaxID=2745851 RepID=A0A838ZMW1_9FLAO|nr:type II toxin-antitoxin system RelE/ParE family toxin [Moheibacter lacus]MBA5628946.1 type II toxin-antitoxin system RelE/ParE family toxin [Moheibacter lacus]